jgi:[histone H3]-lysine4 N-trimethyltransferase SETD1
MSRASAGSFADFFPNAPAVLQQKQKKGLPSSPSSSGAPTPQPHIDGESSRSSAQHHENGGQSGHDSPSAASATAVASKSDQPDPTLSNPTPHEDEDVLRPESGDLLNGVGSASSLASTASSVFSHSNPPSHNMSTHTSNSNGGHGGATTSASALTPLTNGDLSPPGKTASPRSAAKMLPVSSERSAVASPASVTAPSTVNDASRLDQKAITPIQTPPETRLQARPGPGEVKGFRCVYDPDLDKKLHGAERKKRKVHYREFGKEVSFDPKDGHVPQRVGG